MDIRQPKTPKEFDAYYDLRWRVLREPWNQPRGSEKDELEDKSIHIIAVDGGRVIGCGRVHLISPINAKIRFMAVEEEYREKGIGGKILSELEKRAKMKGANKIVLNARDIAVGFYEKYEYKVVGKGDTLFGSVPHFKMEKSFD